MVATNPPLLLILYQKDRKRRLFVESANTSESSFQFHYMMRGLLNGLEIIDGEGNVFTDVETKIIGIDWAAYRAAGVLGFIVLLCELVFGVFMVRIGFRFKVPPIKMPLSEIKKVVSEAVRENPNFYTYAPPDEIIRRANNARTIATMIKSIAKD